MAIRNLLISLLLSVSLFAADQPNLINARLTTRSAAAGLRNEIAAVEKQNAPAWIAWSAPSVKREGQMCCYTSVDSISAGTCGCNLERKGPAQVNVSGSGTQRLEPAAYFYVFVRTEAGRVDKVRVFSADCPIDANGMPVNWLTDVRPADSVQWLASVVNQRVEEGERLDGAVMAIALHDDASADAALDKFIGAGQPASLRKKTAFWIGQMRGAKGLDTLLRLMKTDSDDHFRSELAFPISQSRLPQAEDALIRAAHDDASPRVRSQALFWLAQKAGKKAAGAITDAVERDPDTEVKKKAVFALSQMPKEEGIPLLIQVAKTNANPAVRKQAIFWLGQSNDPKALDYIESVLKK
jgi:HEAT repeats/PBS lyase HEAT-like repeat